MSAEFERILVTGDVCGNLDTLYKRVDKITKKHGEFSMLLCCGSFFSSECSQWENYANESLKAPIQTLILGPNSTEEMPYYKGKSMCDLAHNICYLGRLGVFSAASGLKIVFLSGLESGDKDCSFSDEDVLKICTLCKAFEVGFHGVDVLMTSQWPKNVTTDYLAKNPSSLLSKLIYKIKPRYIFCGHEGKWFERPPYRNDFEYPLQSSVARFIALDKVGQSEKWIYAVEIKKSCAEDVSIMNYEPSPFTEEVLRGMHSAPEKHDQYFFDMRGSHLSKKLKNYHPTKFNPRGPCWFCLSSPKTEKHLVISVGEECYVTLAKGGLVDEHFILTSIDHCQSLAKASSELIGQVTDFQRRVENYFLSKNYSTVFFERNYKTIHLQLNAIPIPMSNKYNLKKAFMDHAESYNLVMIQLTSENPKAELKGLQDYFYVELPSKQNLLIQISGKFPLHFGREVMAMKEILNLPDKVPWEKCVLPFEEEKSLADISRESFKHFAK